MGVVFTDGPVWQEQRRFCMQHLRKLGLGSRSMEAHIEEEARDLVASLHRRSNGGLTAIPMHDVFDICVLNSLWAMLAGHRFDLDDQRLVDLLDIVHKCFRMIDPSGGLLNQMPPLRFIAPRHSGYTNLMTHLNRIWNFLRVSIYDHRKSFNADNMRDLIDLFYARWKHQNARTTHLLKICILYMLLYPQVQRRVQDELDRCVGTDRQPTLQDRRSLRYLEAVLMEIQRHATIAPSGIPHKALKNTVLMGHTIPKGTTVLVSMWSLHRDVQHWGDPEVFRPERFISDNGNIKQDDWFMPFGI
ncbi:hypothetical protein L9F63_002965, partial [Diploptera punctata]